MAAVTFATVDPFQTQDLAILDGQLRYLCVVQGGRFLLFLKLNTFLVCVLEDVQTQRESWDLPWLFDPHCPHTLSIQHFK